MIRFYHNLLPGRRISDFTRRASNGNLAAAKTDKGAPRLKERLCGAHLALALANQFTIAPAANGSMVFDPDRTHVSDLRGSDYL